MSDQMPENQQPSQTPPPTPPQPEYLSPREERARMREERRAARGGRFGSAWIGGVVLILLGVIFLAQNLGGFYLGNWWALFILIPAAGAFGTAWNSYQNAGGQITAAVRGSLFGGLILTLVAGAFLFNLNWGLIWPIFIILAGIGALLSAL
jgi:hypothetical protein